jgi:hypothetical protein
MLKKIYEVAEVRNNFIILDGEVHNAKIGKHCVWVPAQEMKLIWTLNGKIESWAWDRGRNKEEIIAGKFNEVINGFDPETLDSIANEYEIFNQLASVKMSPPVDGMFYVKNVISSFLGKKYCDCMGMWGYYIKDANKIELGNFDFETFKKEFIDTGKITASHGALGDIEKKDNIINGYLVDVRRTIWDMIKWNGQTPSLEKVVYQEDKSKLIENIQKNTQFPHKERKQNYQSFYLDGQYNTGSRDTLGRYGKMNIDRDLDGKTVLDLGCCLGAMCIEAYRRKARNITGIDYEIDYVNTARSLARYNGMHINYMQMDLMKSEDIINYVNEHYSEKIDIVFALSLYKHIGQKLWEILDRTKWKICYVESNNSPLGITGGQGQQMDREMRQYNDWVVGYLGITDDRSPRCIWRITKRIY